MRVAFLSLALTLVLGCGPRHAPGRSEVARLTVPAPNAPPRGAGLQVGVPEPQRARGPGRLLLSATAVNGGLIAPREWIEERPALAGIWPSRPAVLLDEAWVARSNTVCRSAAWEATLETVARGADPRFSALAAQAAPDGDTRVATLDEDGARVRLTETRWRLGHEGRGGLTAPLTDLFICVDGVEAPSPTDAARAFLPAVPSAAPTLPVLELEGVHVLVAELKRRNGGGTEARVSLVLSDDAQTRVADWLVAKGLAQHVPSIAWAFDSSDPKRSFVFYPPRGENLVHIEGR